MRETARQQAVRNPTKPAKSSKDSLGLRNTRHVKLRLEGCRLRLVHACFVIQIEGAKVPASGYGSWIRPEAGLCPLRSTAVSFLYKEGVVAKSKAKMQT